MDNDAGGIFRYKVVVMKAYKTYYINVAVDLIIIAIGMALVYFGLSYPPPLGQVSTSLW